MSRKDEKNTGIIKAVLTTIGVIVVILTALAILYKFFKKYFKITFECGDCDFSEDVDFEPECCVYEGCDCDDCADELDGSMDDIFDIE